MNPNPNQNPAPGTVPPPPAQVINLRAVRTAKVRRESAVRWAARHGDAPKGAA